MRRLYIALIILSSVLCCVFCFMLVKELAFPPNGKASGSSATADEPRENKSEEISLAVGSSSVIALEEADEAALDKWMIGNPDIATIHSGGRIDARKVGETDVTAAFSDGIIAVAQAHTAPGGILLPPALVRISAPCAGCERIAGCTEHDRRNDAGSDCCFDLMGWHDVSSAPF